MWFLCGDGLGKGLVMCSRERRYICGELAECSVCVSMRKL